MSRVKYKEAIGLEVKRGRSPSGKKPSKAIIEKLYLKESRSIREVAEHLGCSKDMVCRALKEYDIERRPGFNRSRLRVYDLANLKREIRKKSYPEMAKELKVDVSTLRKHVKKRDGLQG